jgi:hypothetical protein
MSVTKFGMYKLCVEPGGLFQCEDMLSLHLHCIVSQNFLTCS